MRLHACPDSQIFAQWLLDIGHGHMISGNTSTSITMLDLMHCYSKNNLIESVYKSITDQPTLPLSQFFHNRVILAARNHDVRNLNATYLTISVKINMSIRVQTHIQLSLLVNMKTQTFQSSSFTA